jgi:hypothetical protein
MFIVAEAGVFCVCEQQQMWSIRSMSDASVGIPWMGSGAAGKAAFMLVREISVSADMLIQCHWDRGGGDVIIFVENCQETSRRDTANKRFLELCASIVLIF